MALHDLDVSHDAIVSEHDCQPEKKELVLWKKHLFSDLNIASTIKIRVPFKYLGAYLRSIEYVNNL